MLLWTGRVEVRSENVRRTVTLKERNKMAKIERMS